VTSEDEIGYMTSAFNHMLDTLEKREAENKRLFAMITKSKEEWVATFDAIHDLISIHDRDYNMVKVNKALAHKLGMRPEDVVGKKCFDLFHEGGSAKGPCPHEKTVETREMASIEVDDFLFDGTYEVTTFPIFNEVREVAAIVHIARDITEEKLLREQLLHSEKLSSVGKLVAGIAHELNNPLMGIMGFSQILMDTAEDKPISEIKGKLEKIYNESLRTAKIVQNLLTFSRSKKAERRYLSLNEVVQQTCDLRGYSLKASNINIVLKLTPELPRTMFDPYQMQQVFINILNNAEDAMVTQKGGGQIEISTYIKRGKLVVSFADDGPGVDKDVIRNVFDPFFTTKEVGKGTGLGLSITHGIVTEHNGSIHIKSPESGGAVVTVELPVVKDTEWIKTAKDVQSTEESTGKKILIVDDEENIREALSDILENDGFEVVTASDGDTAMTTLEKKRFSLIITDIKMPGIGGMDLYHTITNKHPYLKRKVIIITGDIFNKDIKDFLKKSDCPYCLKPFEPKELTTLVHRVLSSPQREV
jgi:PAS domain S-box-containing protein